MGDRVLEVKRDNSYDMKNFDIDFLEAPFLRFALLPYYRQVMISTRQAVKESIKHESKIIKRFTKKKRQKEHICE